MKKSRFTDSQILAMLKEAESGVAVPELCRTHGISSATFYKWRAKFGGMDASMMSRLKELEEENRRLKKMYAESKMDAEILREALGKNGSAIATEGDGALGSEGQGGIDPPRVPAVCGERALLSVSGAAFDGK